MSRLRRLAFLVLVLVSLGAREALADPSASGAGPRTILLGPTTLRTEFDDTGFHVAPLEVSGGSWEWGLSVLRYGREGSLKHAAPAALQTQGDRGERRRPGMVEWYRTTPAGLEQGFTLTLPPAASKDRHEDGATAFSGGVVIDQVLSGSLRTIVGDDGRTTTFVAADQVVLRYSAVAVTDADGLSLPARLEGFEEEGVQGIRIRYEDAGAASPVEVRLLAAAGTWQGLGESSNSDFGYTVATAGDVNGDGYSDVIIGAPGFAGAGHPLGGKVYVFLGSAAGLEFTPSWSHAGTADYAYFGWSVASAGDVNGDGYADVIIGAIGCCNGLLGSDGGAALVYLGSASGLAATPAWTVKGGAGGFEEFGFSVAGAGDINCDGYSDVLVGDPYWSHPEGYEGRALVYLGSPGGLSTTPAWAIESDHANDQFGSAVAGAGDVNGDGYADILVGAKGYNEGSTSYIGRAYVYLGGAAGIAPAPVWTATGEQGGSQFGFSVATAGDADGDGYADILVGAPVTTVAGKASAGKAYFYRGGPAGPLASPHRTWVGSAANAQFGIAVATAGDINSDGRAEVMIGAVGESLFSGSGGAAFIYPSDASGPVTTYSFAILGGATPADAFGFSLGTAGDIDGDGISDVVIGQPYFDGTGMTDNGRVVVVAGLALPVLSGQATAVALEEADQPGGQFGASVAPAGDVNGDGYSDVLVGAPQFTTGAGAVGRVSLFLGSGQGVATTAAWTADGSQAGAHFGASVASAGDVNGDGYDDVLVGAPDHTNGQASEGRFFLYLGSPSGPAAIPAFTMESDTTGALLGTAVAGAGDVNGDGYADVLVGAPRYPGNGRAWLYYGSPSGLGAAASWSTAALFINFGQLGIAVASAGDVNGDGFSDVLIGADGLVDLFNPVQGHVYVFYGSTAGLKDLSLSPFADRDIFGTQPDGAFGHAVAGSGDVNADRYSDILIGAPYESGGGRAYLYQGSSAGLDTSPSWTSPTASGSAHSGWSVAGAGDVDGDGYSDLLVGAPDASPGLATIFFGSATGPENSAGWDVISDQNDAQLGRSVAGLGDVDGNGLADVILGAPLQDHPEVDEGAAWIYSPTAAPGVDRRPRQVRGDAVSPIALHGKSDSASGFTLEGRGITPAGRGKVRLQWEVKPLGTPFDGVPTATSATSDTGAPGSSGSAVLFSQAVGGLGGGRFFHWRVRALTTNPFFPRSRWTALPGDAATASKIRTAGCLDRDGDGRGAPNDPACASLIADCNDHDPADWALPGEAANLRFTAADTLVWDVPGNPGAVAANLRYDLLRTSSPIDFLSGAVLCVESDDGPNTTASDAAVPALGQAFYYLVRAQDGCPGGAGPLGSDSAGHPIPGRACGI